MVHRPDSVPPLSIAVVYVFMYICTYVVYIRTCIHTYICMYVRRYIRMYIRTYMYVCVHMCLHTCICTYVFFIQIFHHETPEWKRQRYSDEYPQLFEYVLIVEVVKGEVFPMYVCTYVAC